MEAVVYRRDCHCSSCDESPRERQRYPGHPASLCTYWPHRSPRACCRKTAVGVGSGGITGRSSTGSSGSTAPGRPGGMCPPATGPARRCMTGWCDGVGTGPGSGCWPTRRPDVMRSGELEWIVSVDATVNRAHQHAAGAGRRPAKAELLAKGGGRQRRMRRWALPGRADHQAGAAAGRHPRSPSRRPGPAAQAPRPPGRGQGLLVSTGAPAAAPARDRPHHPRAVGSARPATGTSAGL
jgi:hypothetical protein